MAATGAGVRRIEAHDVVATQATVPQWRVGVCLSGREVRSATFALGVLEALRAAGELVAVPGGWYGNLGLVELLRHDCRLVYCIDIGGDARLLAGSLGRAITLACCELGVEVILDDPLDRIARTGVITGSITYPESRPIRVGALVVVRAMLDQEWHDGYWELGFQLGERAAETGRRAEYGLRGLTPLRSYR